MDYFKFCVRGGFFFFFFFFFLKGTREGREGHKEYEWYVRGLQGTCAIE